MKNIDTQENSENASTKQSDDQQVWEQMDLFKWAGLSDENETCVGFAVRNDL
jgi:hypothetical protein